MEKLTAAVRSILENDIPNSDSEIKQAMVMRHLAGDSAIPVSASELHEVFTALNEEGVIFYNEIRKTVRLRQTAN